MEFWSWFWDFISDPYSWWASEARYYILLAIVFVFLVCWKLWSMTKGTFEIVSTKETNGRLIIEFTFSAKKRLLSKKMKATLHGEVFGEPNLWTERIEVESENQYSNGSKKTFTIDFKFPDLLSEKYLRRGSCTRWIEMNEEYLDGSNATPTEICWVLELRIDIPGADIHDFFPIEINTGKFDEVFALKTKLDSGEPIK
jgi:hypothetical protein